MKRMFFESKEITETHILLLLAFANERNLSQAQYIIQHKTQESLSLGRKIIPYTRELLDWELIKRTNPGAPKGEHVTFSKSENMV